MNDNELYKAVIFDGAAVECNGVSLCNLQDVMNTSVNIPRAKYQVWSRSYTELFYNIDEAVNKFIELKSKRKF
jgi:hypothetical protein